MGETKQPTATEGAKAGPVIVTAPSEASSPPASAPVAVSATAKTAPASPAAASAEIPVLPEMKFSPGMEEVAKLARAGFSEDVIMTFIRNSKIPYRPRAEEIIYLKDVGASDNVINLLIESEKTTGNEINVAGNNPTASAPSDNPQDQPAPPTYASTQTNVELTSAPPVAEAAPAQAVTYNYFYNTLSPYGSWFYVGDYGYCWRPTVAVASPAWRPYCDNGRWVHSDSGWYWNSAYTWGWAPFHYGRWFNHGSYGWCWYPGYTWGPSWVSWRYSPGYCGWAPLPPEACYTSGVGFTYFNSSVGFSFEFGLSSRSYCYVPTPYFYTHHPYRYTMPHAQAQSLYTQTTVINNYITGNNNTIINRGIDVQQVAAASRTEIRKVPIRDLPSTAPASRGDKLLKEGNDLVIYRPKPGTEMAAIQATATSGRSEFRKTGSPVSLGGSSPNGTALAPTESKGAPAMAPGRPAVGAKNFEDPKLGAKSSSPESIAMPKPGQRRPIDYPTPSRSATPLLNNSRSEIAASTGAAGSTTTVPSVRQNTTAAASGRSGRETINYPTVPSQPTPLLGGSATGTRNGAGTGSAAPPVNQNRNLNRSETPPTYFSVPRYREPQSQPGAQVGDNNPYYRGNAVSPSVSRPTAAPSGRVESSPGFRPAPSQITPAPGYNRPQQSYNPAPNYAPPPVSRPTPAPPAAAPGPAYSAPRPAPAPAAPAAPAQSPRSESRGSSGSSSPGRPVNTP